MIDRCNNSNNKRYTYYGARKIYVHPEWLTRGLPKSMGNPGFIAFYDWAMSHGYGEDLTLDRWPNRHGPYSPNNCRWVNNISQSRNRDCVHLVTDCQGGDIMTYPELDSKYGKSKGNAKQLIKLGWSVYEIVFSYKHPELDMHHHPKTKAFIDKDGFSHMIPKFQLPRSLTFQE